MIAICVQYFQVIAAIFRQENTPASECYHYDFPCESILWPHSRVGREKFSERPRRKWLSKLRKHERDDAARPVGEISEVIQPVSAAFGVVGLQLLVRPRRCSRGLLQKKPARALLLPFRVLRLLAVDGSASHNIAHMLKTEGILRACELYQLHGVHKQVMQRILKN